MELAQCLAEQNALRHGVPMMRLSGRAKIYLRMLRHGMENYIWHGYRRPFKLPELATLQEMLLVKFLEEHQASFVAVAEQWFEPDMCLPPLPMRYNELLHWTKIWLFSNKWAWPARILADNSRFTRGIAELISNDEYGTVDGNSAAAIDFCLSPMCPGGIVHIEADSDVILKRILSRQLETNGWRHPGHRNLTDKEILAYTEKRKERNASAVRFFRAQGVVVMTLSASTPINENVEMVQRFLDSVMVQKTFLPTE